MRRLFQWERDVFMILKERKGKDTIAAISTAQAPGGIGIVRISGPQARQVADRVFRSPKGKKVADAPGYTALYGWVYEGEEKLDEAIALVFASPASFTGEDVVELSCHGGVFIMRRVLEAVLEAGAAPAGPGEFTRRAFLNGKMGLTEAEAVMQVISAQGLQSARAARAGKEGALERKIVSIREALIDAAAHLAAWADYPDDDVPQVDEKELLAALREAQKELDRLLRQFDAGRAIREGVDTVIVGRPNVGKSTLMNLLAGCERSIVTQYAGTTRDVVEDTVVLGDILLRLADTAGIRDTDDPVESIGVNIAKNRLQHAQLVLAVFDASVPLEEEDRELIQELSQVPAVAVINKTDLEPKMELTSIQKAFSQVVFISARKGEGLEELQRACAQVLDTASLNPAEGMLYTERQRDDAKQALACVEEALGAMELGMTLDAVTVSVEGAVSALLELTGERATEAVVDSVFAQFCVGK